MLNENGYHRPTYEEILENKIQQAKELLGEDIDTSDLAAFGKYIRIGAYDLSKAYEDLEMVYYARFPNTASGVSLDRLCPFAGIARNPATQAQHEITVYSSTDTEKDVEIGIGELVVCGEDADIVFYSANNYTIPANGGSATVIVECATAGEIGNVTAITDIVNPIAEIDRIEYVGLADNGAGEEAESDYDLRLRFAAAIEGAGGSNTNAIRAAILKVPTVQSVSIIENDGDTTESGRPPHSFECYVYGGINYKEEIAQAIYDKKPIGIQACSTADEPDTVTIDIYDEGGTPHPISFSYTSNIPVYISLTYKKNSKFKDDGETQIKTVLMDYINSLGVGTDVVLSSLYGYIYDIEGVRDVTSLKIGTSTGSLVAENIEISDSQVAMVANLDNIVVEVEE
jgi:uncharacterized phage protein gp47/JayE